VVIEKVRGLTQGQLEKERKCIPVESTVLLSYFSVYLWFFRLPVLQIVLTVYSAVKFTTFRRQQCGLITEMSLWPICLRPMFFFVFAGLNVCLIKVQDFWQSALISTLWCDCM